MTKRTPFFEVQSYPRGAGGHLVVLDGEFDLQASPDLDEELERLLRLGPETIVVDLTDVTFIDSTTLAVLLAADRRLRHDDAELVLACPQTSSVRRILELTVLDRVFRIVRTPDEA